MNNQNKTLCLNGFRQISEDVFQTPSPGRFISTKPDTENGKITPTSVGKIISEADQKASSDGWPPSIRKKLKIFAGKLKIYQHELPHSL